MLRNAPPMISPTACVPSGIATAWRSIGSVTSATTPSSPPTLPPERIGHGDVPMSITAYRRAAT